MSATSWFYTSRRARSKALAFVSPFAVAFWSAFVWTLKVAAALAGMLLGVLVVVKCAAWLVQPDDAMSHLRDQTMREFGNNDIQLRPDEALIIALTFLLAIGAGGSLCAAVCARWLAARWDGVVQWARGSGYGR